MVFLMLCAPLICAPRQLHWSELETAIIGQDVRVVLPDGNVLQGKALRVEPEALLMEVRKTSDASLHPKASSYPVSRSSLKALQVTRMTTRWRSTGTVVGTALGVFGALVSVFANSGGLIQADGNSHPGAMAAGIAISAA